MPGTRTRDGSAGIRPARVSERRRIQTISLVAAVALAAVVSRLPALGAWWCLDDWGQLGRAAGLLVGAEGLPARWLSQHGWWSVTYALLGPDATAHAWLRIFMHAGAAVTLTRIARHVGLQPIQQLAAGLLFAATPIAMTPIYWASGIQELLAGFLALPAMERWLAGGRVASVASGLLGLGSIMAKESAFGLPLFFLASLLLKHGMPRRRSMWGWGVLVALAIAVVGEGILVARHFATGPSDPYALGGPLVMIGNLGKFGWWLPTPGPVFTGQVDWTRAIVGLVVLGGWGLYGAISWRRGSHVPLAAWACALLSLVPALPLVNQAKPYMAYLASAAVAMTLATSFPARVRSGFVIPMAMTLVTVLWGQVCIRGWLAATGADGLPADPVVRATQLSQETAARLRSELPGAFDVRLQTLFIYQAGIAGRKQDVGQAAVSVTPRYSALSGPIGAGLLLGRHGKAQWTNSLISAPADAFVICEKSSGFQAWGGTREALLIDAELRIAAGQYAEAAEDLSRALELDMSRPLSLPVRDVLGIPFSQLRPRVIDFHDWLEAAAVRGTISENAAARLREFPGHW